MISKSRFHCYATEWTIFYFLLLLKAGKVRKWENLHMTTTRWRGESKKLSVMNTQIIFAGVEEAHLLTAGIIKPILLVHGRRDIGSSQIRISFEPIAPRAQLQKTLWLSSSTLTLTWYCGGETHVWRTYNLLLKMVVIYAQIWVPSKAKISKNYRALTFL